MENNLTYMSFSFAKTHADETDQVKVGFVKQSILGNWPKKMTSERIRQRRKTRNFSDHGGHDFIVNFEFPCNSVENLISIWNFTNTVMKNVK